MFEETKAVLFDLDGTIYYGSKLIDGADRVVEKFRELGKKVYFMTNNSTKTRKQICEKLRDMGLFCEVEEIYTSGYAAALYTKEKGYQDVYVFGTDALVNEFVDMGIQVSDEAEVLIIGFDAALNYQKLTDALQAALKAEIIIACNKEKNFPGEDAKRMPGCGAMVGALEGSIGRTVDYVVGKPNPLLLDIICTQRKLQKSEILVIGDTYESDIQMSQEYGCQSVYIGDENLGKVRRVSKIKDILEWQ